MLATKHITVALKAPDGAGAFDGVIDFNPPEGDSDGERIENFVNVPGDVPLSYQHALAGDPGAKIGNATARAPMENRYLPLAGKLALESKLAQAVHERMLLDDAAELALKELSVGYTYDPELVTTDDNGVRVHHDAELVEVSVVYRGAQSTKVTNVKAAMAVLERDVATGLVTPTQAIDLMSDFDVPADIAKALFDEAFERAVKEGYADEEKAEDEESEEQEAEKAPEPATEEAMRSHLVSAHDYTEADVEDASMEDMRATHRASHDDGADHEHEDAPVAEEDDEKQVSDPMWQWSIDTSTSTNGSTGVGTVNVSVVPVPGEAGKAGRVLSKANETKLRDAANALVAAGEAITSILDKLGEPTEEKASEEDTAVKDEVRAALEAQLDALSLGITDKENE